MDFCPSAFVTLGFFLGDEALSLVGDNGFNVFAGLGSFTVLAAPLSTCFRFLAGLWERKKLTKLPLLSSMCTEQSSFSYFMFDIFLFTGRVSIFFL